MKSLRYGMPLIIFIALAVLFYSMLDRDTRLLPSPLINQPAPTFSLPLLDAQQTLRGPADLRGKRWLLNVWASWCAACRDEHPLFNQLSQDSNITMIGLNYKDETPAARQWLAQFGNPYDEVVVDAAGAAGLDWGVYGVPETFLIDEQGIIRYKHVGPIDQSIVERMIKPFFATSSNVPVSSN